MTPVAIAWRERRKNNETLRRKAAEQKRAWRAKRSEAAKAAEKASQQRSYERHGEKWRARCRAYYRANRERVAARRRARRAGTLHAGHGGREEGGEKQLGTTRS